MNASSYTKSNGWEGIMWMAAAVGLSALGMAYHTVMEFGWSGPFSIATGMIPVVSVQVFLFMLWWLSPRARTVTGWALVVTGLFQLLGGAIISVLPLPFLPFEPEQSVSHYLSHLVLGIAQIPLLVVPLRQQRRRVRKHQHAD